MEYTETEEIYHPLPQPDEIPKREKEDAMGAYLMMFAALGAGLPLPMINLIASVVYYYVNRNKSRFVRFHLVQSLWSQIPVTLLNGVIIMWTIRNFVFQQDFTQLYFGLVIAAVLINLVYVIMSVYAAVLARKGNIYYFVFFGKLAFHQVFLKRDEDDGFLPSIRNKPPI
jgi:uncharacterized membrane protein